MKIIDTCALINILNCDLWEIFGLHYSQDVCFQGLVEDECSSMHEKIGELVARGNLVKFDGSKIIAKEVGDMASSSSIGMGEAECIVIARKYNFDFISDDKRARRVAQKVLTSQRVTGSIGVLCSLLDGRKISIEQANFALTTIKRRGGHLPNFNFKTRLIC
jgi:predicted nucleic acid-binding protein